MPPAETEKMEVDSPSTETEPESAKKDVKDVDTTTTEGTIGLPLFQAHNK